MNRVFIGIDPGKDGALAVIGEGGIEIVHYEEGYLEPLRQIANTYKPEQIYCYMERVHSMPRDSGKSAFAFGENYGYVRGLLEALGIPYNTVPPQVWKKAFSLGKEKEDSIKTAHALFPLVDLKRTPKCKVLHDGKAEALLIAEFSRRRHNVNR